MTGIQRPLTDPEKALARSVFGDAIDLERVVLHNRKWFPFQPRSVTMAPRGHIHFHPGNDLFCDCFTDLPLPRQGLFVHELVHVWQYQQGTNLFLRRHPFCRYSYSIKPGWPLARYGIEQQAEIVRHAFLLRGGFKLPGMPDLEVYEGILPFKPA